jgi:hypothetical protein
MLADHHCVRVVPALLNPLAQRPPGSDFGIEVPHSIGHVSVRSSSERRPVRRRSVPAHSAGQGVGGLPGPPSGNWRVSGR